LVLDELGYVPASKTGAELLFDVIAPAYEQNSLIVMTNLPFENWTVVLGRERLTGAALDRLTHGCHILETRGESYRLKDAKRRRKHNGFGVGSRSMSSSLERAPSQSQFQTHPEPHLSIPPRPRAAISPRMQRHFQPG
jgi:hypothetical protein